MKMNRLFASLLIGTILAGLFLIGFAPQEKALAMDSAQTGPASLLGGRAPEELFSIQATTWYVNANTGSDGNTCLSAGAACKTIGAAVTKAANGDTIQIAAGTYNEHDIQLDKDLALLAAGEHNTIVDAGALGRIFQASMTVFVSDLRLQNGQTVAGNLFTEGGGAVLVGGGAHLTLQNVTMVDNHALGEGGAVFNLGKLVLENTQVLSNTANGLGGGLYNYNMGAITVTQSTLAHNTASGMFGGGIYAGGLSLTLLDSTVTDNSAGSFGGGLGIIINGAAVLERVTLSSNRAASGAALFGQVGVITATNLTVSGNNATNNYGGIYLTGPDVSLFLQNSTIAYNTRTNSNGNGVNGLAISSDVPAAVVNTILAFNQDSNCFNAVTTPSLGHNLSSDFTCSLTQSGDLQGVDPLLGTLTDNGGFVPTHALQPGSLAIDAGDDAQCPASDARGIVRPYDGDGDSTAICDIGAVEARHQFSIADASVLEGNGAAVTAVFTVTLSPASALPVSVDYATVQGTATAGADYTALVGTLDFAPGETEKYISVSISGDTSDELDETFEVQLSNPVNGDLLDAAATGTIIDNDGLPTLTIADAAGLEGNIGSKSLLLAVTLSPASLSQVTVAYATSDGSAATGSDYSAASGTLTFQPGETSQTISVELLSDVIDEGSAEDLSLTLSNPVNAALADGQAGVTITDDDEARLTQGIGPDMLEGNFGRTPAVFTITLSTPAAFLVSVDFAVSSGVGDGGAVAGEDFEPASGTLTFQPGVTSQAFTVQIIGDTVLESDEIYWTLISNANVPIDANGSSAYILNDDAIDSPAGTVFLPLVQR